MLLAVPLLAAAPFAGGHTGDERSVLIKDTQTTYPATDTYVLEIDPADDFNLKNESSITVNGSYTGDPVETGSQTTASNAGTSVLAEGHLTFDAQRQEAGAFVAITEDETSANCGSCLVRMLGLSKKDAAVLGAGLLRPTDASASSHDPLPVHVETDPNPSGWNGLQVRINWQSDAWFDSRDGDATYQVAVTVPEAVELEVDTHIHVNKPDQVDLSVTTHDGGFLLVGEDFEPTARADTAAGSAMVNGEATLDFQPDPGERLYGKLSPSWFGNTAVSVGSVFAFTHPTAAVGDYGIEEPDGSTTVGTGLAVASSSGPAIVGADDPGTYRFFVNAQAGAGPQDMYAIGFAGAT